MNSFSEFFEPKNLSFVVINVIIFVFVQTLFFWFILSRNIINIATEATSYQVEYLRSNDEAKVEFCQKSSTNMEELRLEAEKEKREAEQKNIKLLRDNLVNYVLYAYGFLFLLMIWMFFKRTRYTGPDLIIIATVLFAFSSEIFYYVFVLRQTKFISINQLLTEALYPYTTYEYPSVYPEGKLYQRTCPTRDDGLQGPIEA